MKYTSGTNSAVNSTPNTTQKNKPKNASKEKARQGFLANVKRGLSKGKNNSKYTPNTEATYTGNGNAQTRKDSAMQLTSDLNRIDRIMVIFKGALKSNGAIDLLQYIYVFQRVPTDLPSKHIFIKLMETLELFPKMTSYTERETKLKDEAFIKEHNLEHVGMKKNKITEEEKGKGKNGTNVQTYSEYTEAELDTIIENYTQTIFDDVLALFIILTMYLLTVFTTGDTHAFNDDKLVENIKLLISVDPEKEKVIRNSVAQINTSVAHDKEKAALNSKKRGEIFASGTAGILGFLITGIGITGVLFTGILFAPLGVAIGTVVGVVGTISAVGGVVQQVGSTASKMYRIRYDVPKDKMSAGHLLAVLYSLLINTDKKYINNEKYVGSKSRIRFTKDDYTFLKEFEPMFKGWYTDTELYNFILLFTRERLKGLLGEKYNEKRNVPEGWHEFKTEDGKTYYNSNEYSKNEPKSLDRYKLVSWVMPMVPFVNRRNYNDNITIHLPTEFSHGPKTPVKGQMGQEHVTTNSARGGSVSGAINGMVDMARIFR